MDEHDFLVIMLHEFNLGHSAADTARNIRCSWGMESISERTVRRWFRKLASASLNIDDESECSQRSVFHNEHLRTAVGISPETSFGVLQPLPEGQCLTIGQCLTQNATLRETQRRLLGNSTDNQQSEQLETYSSQE
ncbi:hypothetical protein AB6A40_010708 [Gnathostoma spinigerum]|uniref:Mos1 transposase HTH domain-containing protein n=1 Tax=Gnathostoma spinigerum TaxID=75299 RepID=A0ABD6EVK6_9BILA